MATLLHAPRSEHTLPLVTGKALRKHVWRVHTTCEWVRVPLWSQGCVVLAGVLLSGLLTYNSKQWLPALQKRLSKEKPS